MRPKLLSRLILIVAACALPSAVASDALAQTQQLNKTLERKFPEGYCPLPTEFMGTFISATGIIRLTFSTENGYDEGLDFHFYQQQLDNIVVLEASVFEANKVEHPNCFFDGSINGLSPSVNGSTPGVVFFDTFNPNTSPCAWDETDGATIDAGEGKMLLGTIGLGAVPVSTSLTPNVPYVIAGDWQAFEFLLPDDCGPSEICVQVTVDDLTSGCLPLPVRSTTWGAVKSLYTK
jgi:hypothetical protein